MNTPRRVWAVFCLAVAALPGCYSYYPLRVAVLDAQTEQPVSGASLLVRYDVLPLTAFLYGSKPWPSRGKTDANGDAKLNIARDVEPFVRISSPGFKQAEVKAPYAEEGEVANLVVHLERGSR